MRRRKLETETGRLIATHHWLIYITKKYNRKCCVEVDGRTSSEFLSDFEFITFSCIFLRLEWIRRCDAALKTVWRKEKKNNKATPLKWTLDRLTSERRPTNIGNVILIIMTPIKDESKMDNESKLWLKTSNDTTSRTWIEWMNQSAVKQEKKNNKKDFKQTDKLQAKVNNWLTRLIKGEEINWRWLCI